MTAVAFSDILGFGLGFRVVALALGPIGGCGLVPTLLLPVWGLSAALSLRFVIMRWLQLRFDAAFACHPMLNDLEPQSSSLEQASNSTDPKSM